MVHIVGVFSGGVDTYWIPSMRESCAFDYAQADHPLSVHCRAQNCRGAIPR